MKNRKHIYSIQRIAIENVLEYQYTEYLYA